MTHTPREPGDAYDFMRDRAGEVARRLLSRLESLNEEYPSDELRDAIQELRDWQTRLEEPPPT